MDHDRNPKSTASIAGHPIHPMLIPLPITLFLGALFCDVGFVINNDPGWASAAQWMLGLGVASALLAALAGFADFFGDRKVRAAKAAWLHMIGNLMAVALEIINFYLRMDSPQDGVLPVGLTLSIIVAGILGFTGWMGGDLVYKHRVGVRDRDL